MGIPMTPCQVRVTVPVAGDFAPRVVSMTRYDVDARRPLGEALPPGHATIPAATRQLAESRVASLLAEQYERMVVGCSDPRCQCVIEEGAPKLTSTVDLRVETFVRTDEGWYHVEGASEVVRKYYDGICDEVRRRV